MEDKVVKFPTAERHQIFLEPEGHDTRELYVNGLSTSLPAAVQLRVLRTIPGLESVQMTRAGYAIEYDYFPPTQLDRSLQVRAIRGLFFAGQINGTTGYEEAAGQGAIAGLNAARLALGRALVGLGRETSYIGVLIDDLVSRGVDEPYRLFTSRSEFRLTVRQDNAIRRLGEQAIEWGLLDDRESAVVAERLAAEDRAFALADSTGLEPEVSNPILASVGSASVAQRTRIADLVRRQRLTLDVLFDGAGVGRDLPRDAVTTAELQIKYAGYFERERIAADKMRRMGRFVLPADLDYAGMCSLSLEARQKLGVRRPDTLAEAASLPGIGPSDLQNLVIEVERRQRSAG